MKMNNLWMVARRLLFSKWASSRHWPVNDCGQHAKQSNRCLTMVLIWSSSSVDRRVNFRILIDSNITWSKTSFIYLSKVCIYFTDCTLFNLQMPFFFKVPKNHDVNYFIMRCSIMYLLTLSLFIKMLNGFNHWVNCHYLLRLLVKVKTILFLLLLFVFSSVSIELKLNT